MAQRQTGGRLRSAAAGSAAVIQPVPGWEVNTGSDACRQVGLNCPGRDRGHGRDDDATLALLPIDWLALGTVIVATSRGHKAAPEEARQLIEDARIRPQFSGSGRRFPPAGRLEQLTRGMNGEGRGQTS